MTGTPISLEALLQESDWLRRVARALVRDEAAADDLAQDVLDAASSRPPALEGRRLRGWLSTVARRRAARVRTRAEARLRAEHARSRDEAVDPGPERDDALDRVVLHRELARVIADLGAAERTAIVEHYLEGRSFAEIAARSGVSEAAVRQRTSRAVRRLRARLSEDDPRWAQWLPALAFAVPVGPSPATPESVVAAATTHGAAPLLPIAGALLTMKFAVSAGALAIVVLVLVALSSTPGSNARTSRPTFADGVIGRAKPSREFASSSSAVPVPALSRSAVMTADLDLVDEARIAIVDPSGAPIEGLRAACILGNRTVEALAFDEDGTAHRPDERCVIVATAPGFVGREFALDAPEPGELRATRTLDRIEPMEVELEF
ncbi:MAG: RNA polymerase sigma factor, partial [Planctomycetota bacterium]